jgi:N-acetylglucosaminyldiphosphoundecaprenol N-acetyl-beta-D-mannosaminyltransferase
MKRRSRLAGIPLDSLDEGSLEAFVESCMDGKNHQFVLLGLRDLLRATSQGEFRTMVQGAELVLPRSAAVPCAARRFGLGALPLRDEFSFVIQLLAILESRGKSVFLAGGSRRNLARMERNIASTFPGLKIVGRQTGGYPRGASAPLMEAIRKAAPELLLVGPGMPGAEAWIPAAMQRVNSSLFLWCPEMFRVLSSGRKRRSGPPRPGSPGKQDPSPSLPARMAGFLASLWIARFEK